MGDSCCNPISMGRIKSVIEGETNGYVLSLKIGYTVIDDTINGFLKPVNQQVEMVCQQIADDPQLQVSKGSRVQTLLPAFFPFLSKSKSNLSYKSN